MSVLSEYRLATLDDTGNVPLAQLGNAPTGGGGATPPLIPVATVTVAGALVAGKHNPVDATSGTLAMTLPTGQAAGKQISVEKEDATANLVNVTGNIRGVGAVTFPLKLQFESQTFAADSAGSWWPTAGHKTLGSLDARYLISPAQTGIPTVPTAAPGTNTLQTANTAFVKTALAGVVSSTANVDMCAAPYSHIPNDDVTTDFQTVINNAATANQDVTIFFSVPGTYNINGAQVSGTAGAFAYTGQILMPARTVNSTTVPLNIRIKGSGPPAIFADGNNSPPATGGVALKSNATSGNVFSGIPSNAGLAYSQPYTNVRVVFEDLTLIAPSNPQCRIMDASKLASFEVRGNVSVTTAAGSAVGTLTGTQEAIMFPPFQNAGVSRQTGNLEIVGYPTGFSHFEHFVADNTLVQSCNVAVVPNPTGTSIGHSCRYNRLLIQGCAIGIQPAGRCGIEGMIDMGDAAQGEQLLTIINDPNNNLYGSLTVKQWNSFAAVSPGIPVIGAANLRLIPHAGRTSEWLYDDFTRYSTGANYLGASAGTHHVWTATQSDFITGSGSVKASATGTREAYAKYRVGRPGVSRVIRAGLTLNSGTYLPYIIVGRAISGAKAANYLDVNFTGGVVSLAQKVSGTPTTLAASAAATVASSGVYVVDVVVSNPVGGPYGISIFLNGTIVPITVSAGGGTVVSNVYQLSTTEIGNLAETDTLYTADGFGFFNDTGSSFTLFRTSPN